MEPAIEAARVLPGGESILTWAEKLRIVAHTYSPEPTR
jgi:hypothetical protein